MGKRAESPLRRDDEVCQETRGDEQQIEAEPDFELALRQPVRQAGAERRDPARERRDQDDGEQGDETDRQRRQQGLMRQAGEDIAYGADERDREPRPAAVATAL